MKKKRAFACEKGNKNGGFSLVELIVIIAIMGVLAGGVVMSIGVIPRMKLNTGAKKLVAALEKTKTNAMSFQSADCVLEVKDDGIYIVSEVMRAGVLTRSTERLADAGIELHYELGASQHRLMSGQSITITFDRSSGAMLEPVFSGVVVGGAESCTALCLKSGTTQRRIRLIQLTGKVILE